MRVAVGRYLSLTKEDFHMCSDILLSTVLLLTFPPLKKAIVNASKQVVYACKQIKLDLESGSIRS